MSYTGKGNFLGNNNYLGTLYYSQQDTGNTPPSPPNRFLLQENGQFILQENGQRIQLELGTPE